MSHNELPRSLNLAVAVTALLGGVAIAASFALGTFFTNAPFLILGLFAVMCGPASVPLGSRVRLSALTVFVLAAVLLVGTEEAVAVATLGALSALAVTRPRPALHQAVAMLTGYPLEAVLAGWGFALAGGEPGEFTVGSSLVALLFASVIYFLVHTLLAATLVGLEEGTPALVVWFDRYAWTLPSFLSAGAAAALVGMLEAWAGLHAFALLLPVALLLLQHYRLRSERDRERERFQRELERLGRSRNRPPEGEGSPGSDPRPDALEPAISGPRGEVSGHRVADECPPEGVRRRWYTQRRAHPGAPPGP